MSRRFAGFGSLGSLPPELRSAMVKLNRSIRSLSVGQRAVPQSSESDIAKQPGVQQYKAQSYGGRATVVTFGNDSNKPPINTLRSRGTGAIIYIATDTNKVYIWNGTAYKSTTLS